MKGCNYIKRMIDEADKSDLLSFEINEHIGQCADCKGFANERAALRGLLASERRVSAPVNFDAMLKARLAEVKGQSAFSWLGAPGFMRLGAATAGVVLMLFAAQYAGLFSDHSNRPVEQKSIAAAEQPAAPLVIPSPQSNIDPVPVAPASNLATRKYYSPNSRSGRLAVSRERTAPDGYFAAEDGGVVLVRGRNGEMDVPMPTVSVGAQPLVYVSAGQRTARSAASSF